MHNNKKILAIILARGGSKGVPNKNIRELNNKPLIAWTIEEALKSSYLDKVIVSSDDSKIIEVSKAYGADVPFVRPRKLALDDTKSEDAVLHAIKELYSIEGVNYDYIMLLQPTSPLRKVFHIDNAVEKLLNNNSYDSLISVTPLEHPIYWTRKIEDDVLKKVIQYDKDDQYRRQDFEQLYRLNGAIYLINKSVFLQKKTFEIEKTYPFIMDNKYSIDIDSIEDLNLAEFYFQKIL